MRYHRQHLILTAAFDIRRAQAQSRPAIGVGDKLLKDRQLLPENVDRLPRLAGVLWRHAGDILLRRHEQREQPAGKSALLHAWIIEVSLLNAGEEGRYRILAMVKP